MKTKHILITGLIVYALTLVLPTFDLLPHNDENLRYGQTYIDYFYQTKDKIPYLQRMIGYGLALIRLSIKFYLVALFIRAALASNFLSILTYLRKITYGFLAYALFSIVSIPFFSILSTWHKPAGHKLIVISFGTHEIQLLLSALFFMLIIEHMKKAYALEKEAELTV